MTDNTYKKVETFKDQHNTRVKTLPNQHQDNMNGAQAQQVQHKDNVNEAKAQHKKNMANVFGDIQKLNQSKQEENKANPPLQPNMEAKKQIKFLGFTLPKRLLKQENKAKPALQQNMDAEIIPSGSPQVKQNAPKTSDSKLNTYELQTTKVLKTLTPEQKEKAGFASTKAKKTLASQKEAKPALQQNMDAKIIPSGSPQVKQNAFNYEVRAPQPWPPKQKEHAPVFKAFNKTSAPQAGNKAKLPEDKIWSPTPNSSPQDKQTTTSATDNLSKTFGVVQKNLMEKHNISVNPVKKNPSPVKDKIEFFNKLSCTSNSQKSPGQIGLNSQPIPSAILHIDNQNQPTPSAPRLSSTMDANKSFIVHMDNQNQPTPSAPPSPSTMDANKSSVGQNDARKIPAKNNDKIRVGPREKRLMDHLKIAHNVQIGDKVKGLIDLFEARKDNQSSHSTLSDVKVSATNNQSMGKK